MAGGTDVQTIKGLFALLDEWRHLPAYRLEPRADPFFALFLKDVMAEHFNVEIHDTIIPEIPFRRGTLWGEETESPNKSVKVDYAVFTKDLSKVYLVELKTDRESFNVDQEKYLIRTQESDVGFRRLVDGILKITLSTDMKFIPKYIHLLQRLSNLGFVDVPVDVYAHSFPELLPGVTEQLRLVRNLVSDPGPVIEILYIVPEYHPRQKFINFDEFAEIAESRGEIGRIFAEHLKKWKIIQAGSLDPRTLRGTL